MDWTQTTNTIDYGIKEVLTEENSTTITLERIGLMPMPIDIQVTQEDGSVSNFYIPLQMMRANKPNPDPKKNWSILPDWAWAYPTYTLETSKTVKSVVIDPSELMADINRENNVARQ